MRSKLIAVPAALLVSLAMATGPTLADEVEDAEAEDVAECTATEEVEVVVEGDTLQAAAEEAAAVAEALAAGDECVTGRERAIEALTAAKARLSEDGAGGNGVAADVLNALIEGESPSTIGAAHGVEMAKAAAEHRAANQPDSPDQPATEHQPDSPGKPAGSPGRP